MKGRKEIMAAIGESLFGGDTVVTDKLSVQYYRDDKYDSLYILTKGSETGYDLLLQISSEGEDEPLRLEIYRCNSGYLDEIKAEQFEKNYALICDSRIFDYHTNSIDELCWLIRNYLPSFYNN